jgi:hypothetical protein
MSNIYGTMQNQQAMTNMMNMQTAGNLFAKRPFGLGGSNLAQAELGQAGAYNSFQQANYATMNGVAYNQAQLNAQQQQLQQQQGANMTGAMIGAGSSAAIAAGTTAALACWIARECLGTSDNRWMHFRHWLMNLSPAFIKSIYLKYGQSSAHFIHCRPLLKGFVTAFIKHAIRKTHYVCLASPA